MTAINSRLSRLRSPFGSVRIPPAVRMRSWKSYLRESRGESGKEELYETPHFTSALGSSWRFSLLWVGRKLQPKEWLSMRVRRDARCKWFQGQKSPERSERRGRLDLLIGGRVWAFRAASV